MWAYEYVLSWGFGSGYWGDYQHQLHTGHLGGQQLDRWGLIWKMLSWKWRQVTELFCSAVITSVLEHSELLVFQVGCEMPSILLIKIIEVTYFFNVTGGMKHACLVNWSEEAAQFYAWFQKILISHVPDQWQLMSYWRWDKLAACLLWRHAVWISYCWRDAYW